LHGDRFGRRWFRHSERRRRILVRIMMWTKTVWRVMGAGNCLQSGKKEL
jgi:hypothetical protein